MVYCVIYYEDENYSNMSPDINIKVFNEYINAKKFMIEDAYNKDNGVIGYCYHCREKLAYQYYKYNCNHCYSNCPNCNNVYPQCICIYCKCDVCQLIDYDEEYGDRDENGHICPRCENINTDCICQKCSKLTRCYCKCTCEKCYNEYDSIEYSDENSEYVDKYDNIEYMSVFNVVGNSITARLEHTYFTYSIIKSDIEDRMSKNAYNL